MAAAPLVAVAWFALAPPADPAADPGLTMALAAVIPCGAALTGGLQRGPGRSLATTAGAGFFGALGVVAAGSAVGGGVALGTATVAALAGVIGALAAAVLSALLAGRASRARRVLSPAVVGAATAVIVVRLILTL
jgi:hypothetical protein